MGMKLVNQDIHLTPREFDMLANLDKTEPVACADIGITKGNYKNLYNRLARKFGVHTRTAMVIKALKLGYVTLECFDSCPVKILD